MFQLKERQAFNLPLRFSYIKIFLHTAGLLLLTQHSAGQYEVLSSPQQIFTITDSDVILPCHLEPTVDAVSMAVEWTRPDLYPRFVHVRQGGQDLLVDQNLNYERRTSLSINKLKLGDVSLKLSKVKLSDAGAYRCSIPGINKYVDVQLVVGAASFPVIVGVDRSSSGLELQCESKGWFPEPEVLWLDSAGNLLSAGPTETLKGPDGLFTVSSKLNIDKTHGNSFTCRVQQEKINQTRETGIQIQGDVFAAPSGSTTGTIVVLVIGFFVLWRLIENRDDNKMSHETSKQEEEGSKTAKEQDHEKLKEKEEEKNVLQNAILILGEQRKELQSTKSEFIVKLENVEKEGMENEKKLKILNAQFLWDREGKEGPLLNTKTDLENKKTKYKIFLGSIEKKLLKSTNIISKMEDWKKKVEKQIDEIKKAEDETQVQEGKDSFQGHEPTETSPLLESNKEPENEKTERGKPLDETEENEQETMDKIPVPEEQTTETDGARVEQRSKKETVEKDRGENKTALEIIKDMFTWTNFLLDSKTGPENKKTEQGKPLDGSKTSKQETVDKTTTPEEQKTEQKSKQKKVEEEKREKKTPLKKFGDRFSSKKRDKMDPHSEYKTELDYDKEEGQEGPESEKSVIEETPRDPGLMQVTQF